MSAIKELQITTNISISGNSSGDVGLLYHMPPNLAGTILGVSFNQENFWRLSNLVYDSAHKAMFYSGVFGSNSANLGAVWDNQDNHYVQEFTWNYTGNPSGYAGFYIGVDADSTNTNSLKCSLFTNATRTIDVTLTNGVGSDHIISVTAASGYNDFVVPWWGASSSSATYAILAVFSLGAGWTTNNATAAGVSSGGKYIVGGGFLTPSGAQRAYRWSSDSGAINLGVNSGALSSAAVGISHDGSVVCGTCAYSGAAHHAFIWSVNSGMFDIGSFDANAISPDGTVVVGTDNSSVMIPYKWSSAAGCTSLGLGSWDALGVSSGGVVVVGQMVMPNGAVRGVRLKDGILTSIGILAETPNQASFSSRAFNVSADGVVVVGECMALSPNIYKAIKWTESGGMVALQSSLSTYPLSTAHGVSGDGRVIVGHYQATDVDSGFTAFRWVEGIGFETFGQQGSTLAAASPNGDALVGGIGILTTNPARWPTLVVTSSSNPAWVHPLTQITIQPAGATGLVRPNHIYFDVIKTMGDLNPSVINGNQIAFSKVASGTPDYSLRISKWAVHKGTIDGPASDPKRYKGLPRWTYKWVGSGSVVGYGAWRGPTGSGYLWLAGWEGSKLVANGRTVSVQMMQFLKDAQDEYKVQFPAQQIGPFMPRYGRASWEALDTGGYIAGTWVPSTYNKFYYPDNDDWYGYMYRALLSVAKYYFTNASSRAVDGSAKIVLDRWMAWLDVYIIADGVNWQPPSDFYNDGTVGYTYRPVYAYTCIAQACIYKYWTDGDALALKWYRRMLDSMYAKGYQTATGKLRGISRTTEGQNYTFATCVFSGTGGGVGAAATPFITGGKIHRYDVTSAGAGYTTLTMVVSGDGSGATGNAYLSDKLVGAFDQNHTGWEISEIFNTYAMLINGNCPGGVVNYPITLVVSGGQDQVIFDGLIAMYDRNTGNTRPSLRNTSLLPFHEWDIDPYHNNSGIENPMYGDTHVRGAMWTETLAPSLKAALEYARYTGSWSWFNNQFACVKELIGLPSSSTYLYPTPRFASGLSDGYTDIIGGEPMEAAKRGAYDSAFFTVDANKRIIIPAAMGGGNVTWVRGAYLPSVFFSWDGLKARISPDYTGDQRNYADVNSGATAVNVYSGGILSTVIQLSSIAIGSSLQAYYAHRDGTTSHTGEAMSGWPCLHVDPYQGTANDGDNYLMMTLYDAFYATNSAAYSDAADRIGGALLQAGCWASDVLTFDLPLEEESGQIGLYSYNGGTTPFSMSIASKALHIQARVLEAQSPAHYAGIGIWPSWSITAGESFGGFEYEFSWD